MLLLKTLPGLHLTLCLEPFSSEDTRLTTDDHIRNPGGGKEMSLGQLFHFILLHFKASARDDSGADQDGTPLLNSHLKKKASHIKWKSVHTASLKNEMEKQSLLTPRYILQQLYD